MNLIRQIIERGCTCHQSGQELGLQRPLHQRELEMEWKADERSGTTIVFGRRMCIFLSTQRRKPLLPLLVFSNVGRH